jgi:hypothetical protein
VRGIGATKEAAFQQAALALALTHSIITGLGGKQAQTRVELLRQRRCVDEAASAQLEKSTGTRILRTLNSQAACRRGRSLSPRHRPLAVLIRFVKRLKS